ncbi:MAG TPA: TlpA disulfide reductase family protein [Stellaceae bacterium]|nr:TlpA disulfide reductase family protein [Stellaceae bacterium]
MSRSLVVFIGIVVLAFVGVTYVMVNKTVRGPLPPMKGAMAEFKLHDHPVPVPPGAFTDASGKPLDLTAFKGKVTLINFWATWCAPCVKELPSLDRLKHARDGDNFQVETISEDHGGDVAITDYFKKTEISYLPHYSDSDGDYSRLLKFDSLPTTILLDKDGKEIGRYDSGPVEWDQGDAGRFLDFYILPKPAS